MNVQNAKRAASSIEGLIGNTPLIRLTLPGLPDEVEVLAKLEAANPLSSIKDRIALTMMNGAEERKLLRPGGTVIESTSGNTGIGLAALAAARGYRCVLVMPDNATTERIQTVRMLGARVVLTPHQAGFRGCIERALEIHRATPGSWYACQHENPDNPRAHYETTGPEIWEDTGGQVDVLVCGVGTGGTLTGIAHFLRERRPGIRIVAVEPEGSPVLSGGPGGPHRIPGLNGGFVSDVTDISCIDEVLVAPDAAAAELAACLARSMGLLVGISSGAAAWGCLELARRRDLRGQTVVTVFPDSGERYLSWWPPQQED
jgi:cysteine synthase